MGDGSVEGCRMGEWGQKLRQDRSGTPGGQLKIFLEILWILNHPTLFQAYSNLLKGSGEAQVLIWRLLYKLPVVEERDAWPLRPLVVQGPIAFS